MKILLLILLLAYADNLKCQSMQFGEVNPDDALRRLDAGNADPPDLESIASHRRMEAIPKLEKFYDTTLDPSIKGKVADTLIRLGSGNSRYWNYLVDAATEAVDSDAPWPVLFDANGNETGQESSAFSLWVRQHKLTPTAVKQNETFVWPLAVMELTEAADPLAVPILRRGLHSPNYLIQAECVAGLAAFHDRESIPVAIRTLEQAPEAYKSEIAWALNDFGDARASAEARKYLKSPEDNNSNQVRR